MSSGASKTVVARRRPRLALPFTVVAQPNTVRLVAGEDFRYTFRAERLEDWLPTLLKGCDGRSPVVALLATVPECVQAEAERLLERLYGERILVDGEVAAAAGAFSGRVHVEGAGELAEAFRRAVCGEDSAIDCIAGVVCAPARNSQRQDLAVLCQECLDYATACTFAVRCRQRHMPALWLSTGAMTRGFVSPLLLPDSGPRLCCIVHHFRRLSPAVDVFDALVAHGEAGRPIANSSLPPFATRMLLNLALWKASVVAEAAVTPALFRLHVLEANSLEVSSYPVVAAGDCPTCRDHDGEPL